jgi:hypothetical protein
MHQHASNDHREDHGAYDPDEDRHQAERHRCDFEEGCRVDTAVILRLPERNCQGAVETEIVSAIADNKKR